MAKNKGVKCSVCGNDKWRVHDTDTEYGEVLECTACHYTILKSDWLAHTPEPQLKLETLLKDAVILYFVGFSFFLLTYILMGGR